MRGALHATTVASDPRRTLRCPWDSAPGKADGEEGPAAVGVGGVGGAAVCLHQRRDDRQAEPGATVVTATGLRVPPEALEDRVRVARRKAGAVIAHADRRPVVARLQRDLDRR